MNRFLIAAVAFVSFATAVQLNAAVINLAENSANGYILTNGNTYVVQDSISFTNSVAGGSGMSVEDGATVVLYIPTGVVLTVVGANGSGRIGGGAGICVPSNATLVVTGEGIVKASGGSAGTGGDGQNGDDGYGCAYNSAVTQCGMGGVGGVGGGGAGAAIGGCGGHGGTSGARGGARGDGGAGGDGDESGSMGHIYIIGHIEVQSQRGNGGLSGKAGEMGSRSLYQMYNSYINCVGGGGGGGGGGAGSAAEYSIGAGGTSGGGGGGGGGGYAYSYLYSVPDSAIHNGGGGQGGLSQTATGGSGSDKSYYGGSGGTGGAAGAEGDMGELYVSSSAVVNADRTKLLAETHAAAQYAIIFDANGGSHSSEQNTATATLGCSLPECITAPVRKGYVLSCWKDADGAEYYDGNGMKLLSSYPAPSNIVLHAEWIDDPAALVITPTSGATFEESLTLSMKSSVGDAVIYYTLDGSEPSVESTVYSHKFRIYCKTTIKAIAISEGWTNSGVVVASYALGQCPDPVIASSTGAVLTHGQSRISINWECTDGVLRYTTDGSDVTSISPEYSGAFTISSTTTIKAKAFGATYFDSEQAELTVTREWVKIATPVITAAQTFTGSKNRVTITCASEGVTIYYTLDGSEPTTKSTQYEKPFCVADDCTIKAIAVRDEFLDSDVASSNISREWSIGETMGKCDHVFATSGDLCFVRTNDLTAALGESMRSGVIQNCQTSILSTVVVGPGTLTFKWKTSCEEDSKHEWDHAEFVLDGEVVDVLDGITDWQKITKEITSGGEHSVIWRYVKDTEEGDGEDCLWVSEYTWTSDLTETQTTDNPVPYSWLASKCCDVVDEYDSYEKVAKQTALNGHLTVEQCYVAGVDPESYTNDFKSAIEIVDGVPHITWNPDLKAERTYKIYGSTNLVNGGNWEFPTNSLHRFFKVSVEMP